MGRFIARSSYKCKAFFDTLRKGNRFVWTEECEQVFQKIKEYLASVPILQKLEPSEILTLYLAATSYVVSVVLIRDQGQGEKPIYYISKALSEAERNYTKVEHIIYALVIATQKLRIYFDAHTIRVFTKSQICQILDSMEKIGRVAKRNALIKQFHIIFETRKAEKSQIFADFLADLPLSDEAEIDDIPGMEEDKQEPEDMLEPQNSRRWEIFVDGSSNGEGAGIRIEITTPTENRLVYAFRLEFEQYTNNIAEYEAVIHGLHLARELGLLDVRLTSDSQLVIRQIELKYQTLDPVLSSYLKLTQEHTSKIDNVTFRDVCRKDNRHADALAFISSMLKDKNTIAVHIGRVYQPSIEGPTSGTEEYMSVQTRAMREAEEA
ncbi:uncharacterized protein LOC113290862 [Papaver somniferum]|uniref:uncharacterized protein LOC113290862 n=1 Tax=Papaver somniferum TaxID=3469 RepID=UPI000E70434E|nr:uncharacterized protein LOC113290862 [Papaver somniferum]